MADPYRARIPFESLDPLTIGASDDESKIYRNELELEIPQENLLAAIYPDEPDPVPNATEAVMRSRPEGSATTSRASSRARSISSIKGWMRSK